MLTPDEQERIRRAYYLEHTSLRALPATGALICA